MEFGVDTCWEKDASLYSCGNSGLRSNQTQLIILRTSKDESKISGFIRSHLSQKESSPKPVLQLKNRLLVTLPKNLISIKLSVKVFNYYLSQCS